MIAVELAFERSNERSKREAERKAIFPGVSTSRMSVLFMPMSIFSLYIIRKEGEKQRIDDNAAIIRHTLSRKRRT